MNEMSSVKITKEVVVKMQDLMQELKFKNRSDLILFLINNYKEINKEEVKVEVNEIREVKVEVNENNNMFYNLIKKYYEVINNVMPSNVNTLIAKLQKLEQNTNLDYVKFTVKYYADNKISLNFIESAETDNKIKNIYKLKEDKKYAEFMQTTLYSEIQNFKYDHLNSIDNYDVKTQKMIKQMFLRDDFNTVGNHLEFAWYVGFKIDKEMYEHFIEVIKRNNNVYRSILKKYNRPDLIEKYNNWIKEQKFDLSNFLFREETATKRIVNVVDDNENWDDEEKESDIKFTDFDVETPRD